MINLFQLVCGSMHRAEPVLMPVPILLPGSWHLHPSLGFIPPHRPSGLIYHTVTPRVDNEKGRPGNVGECSATDRGPGDRSEFGVDGLGAKGRDSLLFGRPFSSRGADPQEALSGPNV